MIAMMLNSDSDLLSDIAEKIDSTKRLSDATCWYMSWRLLILDDILFTPWFNYIPRILPLFPDNIQCCSTSRRQWNYAYWVATFIHIYISHFSVFPKNMNVTR